MVSKNAFTRLLSLTFFCLALACGSASTERDGTTGPTLLLLSVSPSAGSPGTTVELLGNGFSLVAPENVVTVGQTSAVASTYRITETSREAITFDLPANAQPGEGPLFVVVEGEASNSLTFTVTP